MSGFHGTDEQLDREISTVEKIARLRVRRAADDLRQLENELRELRRERARRRARAAVPGMSTDPVSAEVTSV
ncbi:MAG TPA: hypothetical protein VEH57_03360 [Thermoplasmata archaeon]|nr:hypothetical protein [Thermoplasmata archaeon]